MPAMPSAIRELHEGEGRQVAGHDRRTFLKRLGLGAAAVTVGSTLLPIRGLVPFAAAQASGDAGIAAFAESVELAAVEAYKAAAASGKVTTKAVLDAATTFAGHHAEHAAAFGGAAGSAATKKPNAKLLTAVGGQLQSAPDEKAVIKLAYDLENAAAATYLFALGALTSVEALQLTASILPVEAQHAVVLGNVLGLPATDYVPPFETTAAAVKPADYPI
jgi:hypothetical protein